MEQNFKLNTTVFGKFSQLNLTNLITQESIAIIPEYGAIINKLILHDKKSLISILSDYKTPDELIAFNGHRSAKLSPFPNRIADGQYIFNDNIYQLPINFPSQHHAIHGFVSNKKFKLIQSHFTRAIATLKFQYKYPGGLPGYPFPFIIDLTYTFRQRYLKIQTQIINLGTSPIPIGDGWHPYFKTKGSIDKLSLKLPRVLKLEDDERQIPTGKKTRYFHFRKLEKIGTRKLDNCFHIQKSPGKAEISLYDPIKDTTITLWQETGEHKYNYIQIYTPRLRKCIAIEPMTCSANAFNSQQDLIILNPNGIFEASYGICIK